MDNEKRRVLIVSERAFIVFMCRPSDFYIKGKVMS
jgi:hypothetical protein